MLQFQQVIQSAKLKPVSWFKPAPSTRREIAEGPSEFGPDTCLDCGHMTKLIMQCNGQYMTCVRCGWIEPYENLNDVEFGDEIKAELWKKDAEAPGETDGYSFFRRSSADQEYQVEKYERKFVLFLSHLINPPAAPRKILLPRWCLPCVTCGGETRRFGKFKNKHGLTQRFRCDNCLVTFSDAAPHRIVIGATTFQITRARLSVGLSRQVIESLLNGNSQRHTSRITKVHTCTVKKIHDQIKAEHSPLRVRP